MPPLGTILTALVTPFDAQLRVDEDATVRLMEHVVAHGSDGLVMCGTTGEAATLSDEEHLRVIELAVQELGDRATIVAGVGSNDTRHAVKLTERATELGVDGLLHVTPYYNRPNERGIKRHFAECARATDKPIMLYNIPLRTGRDMSNALLAELAQELDNVVAVKQSNADSIEPIDGLDVYSGDNETFCDVLEMGGAGGVLVASHIVGDAFRRMVDEPDRRREIDAGLRDLFEALAVAPNPIGIKAALNLLGHDVGGLRLPMVETDERETAVIRAALERHGLLATVS
ncbi:MAG TPA: 4-hydroxy-tetrahydrodipicolinate synthase [Conexibacter sp.]|nr:4-hydroxy-tetrahydrodipicolinate synthase [Conexibacter sp.]